MEGYECSSNEYCVKSVTKCTDGTFNNECSSEKPYYCMNGSLVEKCLVCGCEKGECMDDGSCRENHPPVLHPIYDKTINEGENLEFTLDASDLDDDEIYFFSSNLPPGATFNEKIGRFSWTPGYNQTGNYWTTFAVVDSGRPTLADEETIRITVGETNRPPVLKPIGDVVGYEDALIEFVVSAEDPDGDNLSYRAEGVPRGAKFDNAARKFSWIPVFDQKGNYKVIFTVSDGKLNASAEVLVTVGDVNRPPKAKISYPLDGHEIFSGREALFSATGSNDPDNDSLTYVWKFGDGGMNGTESETITHVYEKPGNYSVSLLVTDRIAYDSYNINIVVQEELVKDSDNDGIRDEEDKCPGTPPFTKVSAQGCPLPKYTEFENNLTTDFSGQDLLNATYITIGKTGKGKIDFRKNGLNVAGKNLDKYVEIGDMNVTIRTENAPELNRSAVVTFYNVTIDDPLILRDMFYCADCKIINRENDTLVFSVPHFTTYSLMSRTSYSGYCGDGLCSIYETCAICREDCGDCKGETTPPKQCEEMWVCSGWSECNELNLRTRECTDINLCGAGGKKPSEAIECGSEGDYSSMILFSVVVVALLFLYAVAETYKKRKEDRKMDEFELEKFIKGYIYRGYTSAEITNILEQKGYAENDVTKILKKIQKEIF
jgi:PKD repeat protein